MEWWSIQSLPMGMNTFLPPTHRQLCRMGSKHTKDQSVSSLSPFKLRRVGQGKTGLALFDDVNNVTKLLCSGAR